MSARNNRSEADDLRVALHEAGHLVINKLYGVSAFATVEPGDTFSGLCWGEGYIRSELSDNNDGEKLAVSERLLTMKQRDGEPSTGISAELYLHTFKQAVVTMAGTAAEELLCTDGPPWHASSDLHEVRGLASVVCTDEHSVEAFVTFAKTEATALLVKHRGAVEAIAAALVAKRTLDDPDEINRLISEGLSLQSLSEDQAQRDQMRRTAQRAAVSASLFEPIT